MKPFLYGYRALASAVVLFAAATQTWAHEDPVLEEVLVEGRLQVLVGEARSASEGVIGKMDLDMRPMLRPGDVLEAIPGLIVTQHSGSGKSNQMFLRGFNLDHGTDFATWIDGMPVNMRTHGHGQGYTDINFLIPEAIESIDFVKGPYHAELGDFSSAGGAHIRTADRIEQNQLKVAAGQDGFARILGMGSADIGDLYVTAALEAQAYDGPWEDVQEDVKKRNGILKLGRDDTDVQWNLTAMFYDNEWNSADQIPKRAVDSGLIDELGSVDSSLGGNSRRASLSGSYTHQHEDHRSRWSAYLIDYDMQLWSNFTYLLDEPTAGDQFEQVDDRRIAGGSYDRFWISGSREHFHHRFGVEFRYDDIDTVGLYRTQNRQRFDTVREDGVSQSSAGVFYELAWRFSDNWRTVLGVRGDFYDFDVDAGDPRNSGDESEGLISPKAALIYSFSPTMEAYLSAGRGFHSNDARGTTITVDPVSGDPLAPVDPLVKSRGAELGFKALWFDRWNTSLALWHLELDSELLFVGDAGTTEANRPSRRWGLEFNNIWAINDVWILEADLAWTDSEFSDSASEGREIPGALRTVVSGAITASYPSGWFGSLRLRHFEGYPLIEDNSVKADGSTLANLALGWAGSQWRLQLNVLNLLDSNDHDIDYFYGSRLPGEPVEGAEDIHFKVFEPRQFRAEVTYLF